MRCRSLLSILLLLSQCVFSAPIPLILSTNVPVKPHEPRAKTPYTLLPLRGPIGWFYFGLIAAMTGTAASIGRIASQEAINHTFLPPANATALDSAPPPAPPSCTCKRWLTEPEIRGWNSLMLKAILVGVFASVGRIAFQEGLNREWGPKDSWDSEWRKVGPGCECVDGVPLLTKTSFTQLLWN